MNDHSDINRALMLDANAAGGLLYEIFAAEMTASPAECAHCGRQGPIGSLLAGSIAQRAGEHVAVLVGAGGSLACAAAIRLAAPSLRKAE